MRRIAINPRNNWEQKVLQQGFLYYPGYYNETSAYEFTPDEIDRIEATSEELFERCLDVVQHVIDNELWKEFHIHEQFADLIKWSWNNDNPSFYGRFDLAVNKDVSQIKMLEYNGDTPTSLLEASVIQWYWLQEFNSGYDQYNSIHEKLIAHIKECGEYLNGDKKLWFASVKDCAEDYMTVKYLQDIANAANVKNDFLYVDEIGILQGSDNTPFVTPSELPIHNIFKLYPYEWLFNEQFGQQLIDKMEHTLWIEPPYKAIMSNKMLLVYLHKLFPNHPNILPAFYGSPEKLGSTYVKKPVYGREGHNIEIVKGSRIAESTDGEYGEEGFVYQQYFELPVSDGMSPVIGSWMIGGVAAGMGIKETPGLVHTNMSKFVPHYFKPR